MLARMALCVLVGFCVWALRQARAADVRGVRDSANNLVQCLQGTGRIVQSSDTGEFGSDRQVWNEKISRSPAVIVYASSVEQVQQVVRCGRQNNIQVSPRSGGHSYEGYSVKNGTVLVDITGLDSVQLLDSTDAVIGAGVKLGPLYLALWQQGQRVFPAGVCPGVGAGGHLTGGGVGMLGRKYGLASDQILSVDIVDALGNLITADAGNNSDLLFASQGGGGGSFGIVTSFTVKTYPAPAITTNFQVNWDISNTMATLSWWQAQAPAFPDELSSDFMVFSGIAQFSGLYLGSQTNLMDVLAAAGYQSLPGRQSENFQEMSYIEAALQLAVLSQGLSPKNDTNSLGLGPGTSISPRSYFTAKSQIVTEAIAADGIQQIHDAFVVQKGQGYWQAHAQQGAIGRIDTTATAYPHRDAIMITQLMATWDDPSNQASAESWLNGLYSSTVPYVSPNAAYVNYIDADQQNWPQAYFGANLPGLQQIKVKYDPDNFWSFQQSIPLPS